MSWGDPDAEDGVSEQLHTSTPVSISRNRKLDISLRTRVSKPELPPPGQLRHRGLSKQSLDMAVPMKIMVNHGVYLRHSG